MIHSFKFMLLGTVPNGRKSSEEPLLWAVGLKEVSILRGKYNTKQREKILEYLKNRKDTNTTAEDILMHFSSTADPIGKATVYRYLNNLVDENIIKKYMLEERNCSFYQYIDGKHCNEHYHLKCEKCDQIIHLECEKIEEIQNHIFKEHNFQLDKNKTILYGICNKCQAMQLETKNKGGNN